MECERQSRSTNHMEPMVSVAEWPLGSFRISCTLAVPARRFVFAYSIHRSICSLRIGLDECVIEVVDRLKPYVSQPRYICLGLPRDRPTDSAADRTGRPREAVNEHFVGEAGTYRHRGIRRVWENKILETLDQYPNKTSNYVLLRSEQVQISQLGPQWPYSPSP